MLRRPPRSPPFPSPPLFRSCRQRVRPRRLGWFDRGRDQAAPAPSCRSEEHTSELQSQFHLLYLLFFFNAAAPPALSPLPLPAALPILPPASKTTPTWMVR